MLCFRLIEDPKDDIAIFACHEGLLEVIIIIIIIIIIITIITIIIIIIIMIIIIIIMQYSTNTRLSVLSS